jgi:hypothetical protein
VGVAMLSHEDWLQQNPRTKLPRERLEEMLAEGLLLHCGGCGQQIRPRRRGGLSVQVNADGQIVWVRCATCIRWYREQKTQQKILELHEQGWTKPRLLTRFSEADVEGALTLLEGESRRPARRRQSTTDRSKEAVNVAESKRAKGGTWGRSSYSREKTEQTKAAIAAAPTHEEVDGDGRVWRVVCLPPQAERIRQSEEGVFVSTQGRLFA